MSIVTLDSVFKTYGSLQAVRGLSFSVPPSSCFGLLGPNGAGKSTVMKMLYGKVQRDAGEGRIGVFDCDPRTDELMIKSLTGVVPQDNNLDEELNVEENLDIYARFYAIPRPEAKKRIATWLEFMELGDKKKARMRELSGGMKRRLIIARALLNTPRLLILDEPTTGLDPQVRHLIWDKLRQLKKEGLTILLTTHYMEEAFQLCDQILIMHNGQKVSEGEPRELIDRHIEKFVLEIHHREVLAGNEDRLRQPGVRQESTEQRLLLYANTIDALKAIAETLPPGESYLRESNLEDLFLKETGRGLNED